MNIRRVILEEYDRQKELPFVWGETDCFRTACAFAKAIIGYDPQEYAQIPTYDSEVSAKRIMLERNWRDMGDVADSLFDEIPVSLAQSGDWATVQQDECGLGVVLGWQVLIRSKTGMGFVPLTHASRAFRVY